MAIAGVSLFLCWFLFTLPETFGRLSAGKGCHTSKPAYAAIDQATNDLYHQAWRVRDNDGIEELVNANKPCTH